MNDAKPRSRNVLCKGAGCYGIVPEHKFRLCRKCVARLPPGLRARLLRLAPFVSRGEATAKRLYTLSFRQALRWLAWSHDRSAYRPSGPDFGGPNVEAPYPPFITDPTGVLWTP